MKTITHIKRWALTMSALLVLCAPSPGSIGQCSEDAKPADPESFCKSIEYSQCSAQGLSTSQTRVCQNEANNLCDGWRFPDCIPSTIQSKACIEQVAGQDGVDDVFQEAAYTSCQFCEEGS